VRAPALACGALSVLPSLAFAHTGERGFILLLPTGLYVTGGALAVALSFVVMAALPSRMFSRLAERELPLAALPKATGLAASGLALAALALLVVAGFAGSRDPLDNPLPLTVWTLWWVGFTFLVALVGNLWTHFNPWRALHRLAAPLARRIAVHPYPERLGYWPAVAGLAAFGWFELVYPSPQDPRHVAIAAIAYAAVTLAGMLRYGEARWLDQGETFSVFFRIASWLSPFAIDAAGRLALGIPCRALLRAGPLPKSGIAFVLVALASVSFDGLSRTFWWLSLVGANPLEHPGRSSLLAVNTLGLAATAAALGGLYFAAVRLGSLLASAFDGLVHGPRYGDHVAALVPIAFGYHFAHYLPAFLVDSQHALRALADPFALGWNLAGARALEVTASFLTHHESVHAIWKAQVAGIVLAHVAAVFVAHLLALWQLEWRAALAGQLPMTVLMIGYTVFGLWLLSTPVAA